MESWRSYATMCRLCLQKDGFMLGIFNNIQGKEKSIHKKIIDCTALMISHGDGLPNVICHRCLFKIEFCLEFRQQCFMSDATLRQLAAANKENNAANGNSQLPVFEQLASQGQNDSVVMVVDPMACDYESDYDSDKELPTSDVENGGESINDLEPESRGVTMCKYCDHAFSDPAECLTHETVAHDTDKPYNCHTCSMGFADRVVYSAHLKSIHKNDKPYNCPQCDRTFARRSDLRKHTIVHTGVKPFTCPTCGKSFSRNTNLSKHMRLHSGTKPFVCPKCPRTFPSKRELLKHALVHAGQKMFSCSYCHVSFRRKDKLQQHEKRHFPRDDAEDRSQELQALRETLSIYPDGARNGDGGDDKQENMVIVLDPFNHNNFPNEGTPQDSNNSENEPSNDLEVSGDTAEELPKDDNEEEEEEEEEDETSRNGDEPFKCSQCSERFSKAEDLLAHQASHGDASRPFGCHICPKTFMRKREMDRHVATHSGMKPFECPRCSKSFGRKDKMIRHMRIHDVSKSFNCTLCESTFNRKDGLQQHMRVHANKGGSDGDDQGGRKSVGEC